MQTCDLRGYLAVYHDSPIIREARWRQIKIQPHTGHCIIRELVRPDVGVIAETLPRAGRQGYREDAGADEL